LNIKCRILYRIQLNLRLVHLEYSFEVKFAVSVVPNWTQVLTGLQNFRSLWRLKAASE